MYQHAIPDPAPTQPPIYATIDAPTDEQQTFNADYLHDDNVDYDNTYEQIMETNKQNNDGVEYVNVEIK